MRKDLQISQKILDDLHYLKRFGTLDREQFRNSTNHNALPDGDDEPDGKKSPFKARRFTGRLLPLITEEELEAAIEEADKSEVPKFALVELIHAMQQGNGIEEITDFFKAFEKKTVISGVNRALWGIPAVFWVIETNRYDFVRIWIDFGGRVDAPRFTWNNHQFSTTDFAIVSSYHNRLDPTDIVDTLLRAGAPEPSYGVANPSRFPITGPIPLKGSKAPPQLPSALPDVLGGYVPREQTYQMLSPEMEEMLAIEVPKMFGAGLPGRTPEEASWRTKKTPEGRILGQGWVRPDAEEQEYWNKDVSLEKRYTEGRLISQKKAGLSINGKTVVETETHCVFHPKAFTWTSLSWRVSL